VHTGVNKVMARFVATCAWEFYDSKHHTSLGQFAKPATNHGIEFADAVGYGLGGAYGVG